MINLDELKARLTSANLSISLTKDLVGADSGPERVQSIILAFEEILGLKFDPDDEMYALLVLQTISLMAAMDAIASIDGTSSSAFWEDLRNFRND